MTSSLGRMHDALGAPASPIMCSDRSICPLSVKLYSGAFGPSDEGGGDGGCIGVEGMELGAVGFPGEGAGDDGGCIGV